MEPSQVLVNNTTREYIDIPVPVQLIHLILGIAILVVNLFVMVAYIQDKDIRRVPTSVYIMNLSISDFITGMDLIARFVWAVGLGAVVPLYESVPCLLLGALHYGSFVLSTLIVIQISWDRLKMVSDPFKYRQMTVLRAVIISLCSWCVPMIYVCYLTIVVPVVARLFRIELEGAVCLETHLPRLFVILSFLGDFIIPFIILFVLNSLVVLELRKATLDRFQRQKLDYNGTRLEASSSEINSHQNSIHDRLHTVSEGKENTQKNDTLVLQTHSRADGDTRRNELISTEQTSIDARIKEFTKREFRKVHRTAAILRVFVGAYFICWMPFYVILVTDQFTPIPKWVILLSSVNISFNSFINPFLYAYMSRKFRRRFLLMLKFRKR
ncbi:Histamine H4 receptor [Holothuria leucospilota]|uniref:Histamine H4 receptor n=1 Tax=Holothuria leucospilota TaxID=206669 RepID=A0A9Q1CGN5_HOLLE|nr:Histamine H4 receptor [Holothuria leucospilota]